MADTASLSQDDLEILVSRELRKAGLVVPRLRVRRRTPLEAAEGRWVLLLEGTLRADGGDAPLLVECHSRLAPVDAAHARAFLEAARETAGTRALIVSTSGFAGGVAALAASEGIALLTVADGQSAWQGSPWGSGRPPAWFPEFVAQLVVPGEAGLATAELLQAGMGDAILARMRPQARA